MSRLTVCVLVLALLVGGCVGGRPRQAPPPIAVADAEALVSAFVQDKVEGRFDQAFERLVPERRGLTWVRTPGWFQFQIVNRTEWPEGWLIETREYLRGHEPSSVISYSYYLVVRREGRLLIEIPELLWGNEPGRWATAATQVLPAFHDVTQLVLLQGGREQVPAFPPQLPDRFRPGRAPGNPEFGVDRTAGFAALALAPDLKRVAFVTRGTHAFLGITDLKGKVQGLDLWFEGGAGELAWSLDGKYLAVTAQRPHGGTDLQVWVPGEDKPLPINGTLPAGPEVQVTRLQWRDGTLLFSVGQQHWQYLPGGEARQL